MPSKKFDLLSERERKYLQDPDSFDAQTAADIRYRLRGKWESIEEDTRMMEDTVDQWAKEVLINDSSSSYPHAFIQCRSCAEWKMEKTYTWSHIDTTEYHLQEQEDWKVEGDGSIARKEFNFQHLFAHPEYVRGHWDFYENVDVKEQEDHREHRFSKEYLPYLEDRKLDGVWERVEELRQDWMDEIGLTEEDWDAGQFNWVNLDFNMILGFCPECVDNPDVIEQAREQGTVPYYTDEGKQICDFSEIIRKDGIDKDKVPLSESAILAIYQHRKNNRW
jgi:hypothetical protein